MTTHQNKEGLEALVRQLRSFAEFRHENHEGYNGLIDPTCTEAADAISSLSQENGRLRKALEPFARAPDEWTVETVNTARAALSQNQEQSE